MASGSPPGLLEQLATTSSLHMSIERRLVTKWRTVTCTDRRKDGQIVIVSQRIQRYAMSCIMHVRRAVKKDTVMWYLHIFLFSSTSVLDNLNIKCVYMFLTLLNRIYDRYYQCQQFASVCLKFAVIWFRFGFVCDDFKSKSESRSAVYLGLPKTWQDNRQRTDS